MTKICIFGAGAIGCLIGGRLAASGTEVSLIARGRQLEAIDKGGLVVEFKGEQAHVHPPASADPADFGPQDYVFLTVKAPALGDAAAALGPLLGDDTTVVPAQNGLPWWHFLHPDGPFAEHCLVSLDPDGRIAASIGFPRVLGCVLGAAAEIIAPGHVRCTAGGALTLGEPDGADSERALRLAVALEGAGFGTRISNDIRGDVWAKLLGNVSFSVIAALTGAGLLDLAEDPETCGLARRMMAETAAIAAALGITIPVSVEDRIASTRTMGNHKTSILQDLEAGRQMEVDAIAGSVLEAARLGGVAAPMIRAAYALLRTRAIEAGLYPDNPALAALLEA